MMSAEAWYVMSALLAPIGYVVQDAVADAMTVEAVPRVDENGRPIDAPTRKLMHTTMQTLGRVAIIGGSRAGRAREPVHVRRRGGAAGGAKRRASIGDVYLVALAIPGDFRARRDRRRFAEEARRRRLSRKGVDGARQRAPPRGSESGRRRTGGYSAGAWRSSFSPWRSGSARFRTTQEIIFVGSFAIVVFLIATAHAGARARCRATTLVGTAIVIFVFRAVPIPGSGRRPGG